ncbi:MAG TPA: serine/threonine-protein kinase [Gemmatimonadaceae bacterium]|nr:serine/threonine-protein kinase [Gemmatimonadaceae bacterium]
MTDHFRDDLIHALGSAYTIQRELTGGGMSRVFVATEHALNRTVVIKVLKPDLAADVNRERFRREIMVVAQLNHPHVVPVLNAGEHRDLLWYTMPFVEGESLREALRNGRTMSAREVTRVLHDVLDALDYAHTRGVIHRDIKPGNILRQRNHSLVTDFGVAKALSAAMPHSGTTSAGIAIGTPAYMAPEQLAADPRADHRLDLYAVGLLAYELLTGVQPFAESSPQATMAAQLTRMPAPLGSVRPDLPPQLSALIMRLLAKSPEDRPASAAAALQELESFTTPPDTTPAPGWTGGVAARARRWPRAIAVGAMIVAAGAVYGILHDREDPGGTPAGREVVFVPVGDTTRSKAGSIDSTSVRRAPATSGVSAATPGPAATKAGGAAAAMPRPPASTSVSGPSSTPAAAKAATQSAAQLNTKTTSVAPRQAARAQPPSRRFTPARKVAVIPTRFGTARVDLGPTARALSDSLRKAFTSAGYTLATDAELVQLLAQPGTPAQRRAADAAGIGAMVLAELGVRGSEVRAQVALLDIWKNSVTSATESADLDRSMESLEVVRDATRALDRLSWRTRSDPRAVIVFDFDNLTGADSLTTFARQLASVMRATIARELPATTIGDSTALATTDVMERREVAIENRAGALVSGSILRARNDSITIRFAARDMTEDRSYETIEIRVPIANALEAVAPAMGRLMTVLRSVNWGPKAGL